MRKITLKTLINKKGLQITFFMLCALLISENAISSRQTWNRDFNEVSFDRSSNCVVIKFKIFDYHFGPANENGFLEFCDFAFTTDELYYHYLMRAETYDQRHEDWTWVIMKNKLLSADLRFEGCYSPKTGSAWSDYGMRERVEVKDTGNKAFLTIRWYVPSTIKVKKIQISGKWHVNGVYTNDYFWDYYDVPQQSSLSLKSIHLNDSISLLKTEISNSISKGEKVKITNQDDAIVVKGAELGENIRIYNTSGVQVNATIASSDVVRIKLPTNELYIVHVGKARYKVAL